MNTLAVVGYVVGMLSVMMVAAWLERRRVRAKMYQLPWIQKPCEYRWPMYTKPQPLVSRERKVMYIDTGTDRFAYIVRDESRKA